MPISPVMFQTGDIVEAKISFMVTAVRGGEFRMLVILRGLTLFNPVHSQVNLNINQRSVIDVVFSERLLTG